jgi:hypothetical protein
MPEYYVAHNLVKFASNMETVIPVDCAKNLNGDWNKSWYSNELRTFIFKFHSNILPVNTVLSHFVRGVSRNCTFCNITRNPDPVEESVFHLFFDCPTAESLREQFFDWLTYRENFRISRHEFFCCGPVENRCEIWVTVSYLFKFYIWDCKKRNTIPLLNDLKQFILGEILLMEKISKKFSKLKEGSRLVLTADRLQG